MKEQWVYSKTKFDADKYDDTILKFAPWSGHRNFGYDLVTFYEPECIVELGSHYGCSAFSFMQAIKNNKLTTEIYCIDLWEATDRFTQHDYERNVYDFFCEVKGKEFSDINAKCLKMSFDDASEKFSDKSVDVLHIDGSHDYKDVKHDFNLWLSKMKDDGIILFHDVSEQIVLDGIMGSCKYWQEIKQQYKYTVEMLHSWGLGILFLSQKKYTDFIDKVNLSYYLQLNLYHAENAKDRIRKDYFKLKDANYWIDELKKDKEIADRDNQRILKESHDTQRAYEKTLQEKDVYIAELRDDIHIWEDTNQKIKADYEYTLHQKEDYIDKLKTVIENQKKENQKIQKDYELTITGKDVYIRELEQRLQQSNIDDA